MSNAARIEELQRKFDENPRRYFAPLANECRKAGDLDAAIAICRAHLPQQPGHMSGHIVYGQALFEAGELDESRTVFETALGLDPENLIALRHMGDIAGRHGDVEGARQWYQRVLDADPRNEEVQALLAGLDGPGAAGAPAPELPTLMEPALVAAAADAVPEPPVALDEAEARMPAEPSAADNEYERASELLDLEPTSFDGAPAMGWGADAPPAVEPAHGLERDDVPPLADAFTLDGFEATSFDAPPTDEPRDEPRDEPKADAPERAPERPATPDFEPLDLDAAGFGATGLEPTSLSLPEPEPEAEQPAAADADAFVTETMAELYLQQGYPDRALDVYRQLVAQSPGDAGLRERMARVEREGAAGLSGSFATEAVEPEEPAPRQDAPERPAPAPRGPTIREFLTALATGQPVPQVGGEIAEVVDVAEAAQDASAGDSRLDSLFGSPASGDDVHAADTLSGAFTPGAEPPAASTNGSTNPLSGRPARPAGNDLSLDHVFGQPRQSGGTPRPTGGFSFDQFFAEGAVHPEKDEARESRPDANGDEDLEQFNDWLKGLKNQ